MESIEVENYYHIYNRGAGKADIFCFSDDYKHFINKYFYYLYIPAETYAWCLLRNHFHLLIRVRTAEEQETIFHSAKNIYPAGTFYGDHFNTIKPYKASKQFSHLFNSYTKYFNAKNGRSGTLVEGSFKRKRIVDEANFLHLACYIQRNPIHHGITENYTGYTQSSYQDILAGNHTLLERNQLMDRFGGKENFIASHQEFREKLGSDFYLEE
ncbi:MAG: hypothetical protein WEA56_12840 [Balneolaceae bacterium]